MINGPRLKQAREALELTQASLAAKVGVPQSVISRLEIGNYPVTNEEIYRLANALDVPVKFLFRAPVELSEGSLGLFRSLTSKVKSTEYRASRRLAEIGIETILRLAEGTQLPVCRLRTVTDADLESAGLYARSMLRLPPEEPIDNLTLAMERSGVLVLRLSGISEHITGFSAWLDPMPGLLPTERPMVVTRRLMSAFRLRFTLAHELGHLLLGHQVFSGPQQPVERDANLFAQALLLPRDPALEDLGAAPLGIERLAELKGKWGVSMHSLAMRAKYLGVISESGYRNIYESLRHRGFLKKEPGDATTIPEQPRLLTELIAKRGLSVSSYDVADELNLGLEQTRAFLGDSASGGLDLAFKK